MAGDISNVSRPMEVCGKILTSLWKKRKRDHQNGASSASQKVVVDTSRPTAIFNASGTPRKHTLSVALPGSFLNK